MTDYRTFFDKDYIGAWSLPEGKDVTVTIAKVVGGQLTGVGGRKTRKPVIYMQGTEKGLALNATNSKTIAGMYGNHVEAWVGKRVTLFKTTTTFGSEQMECVRIRPRVPPPKGHADGQLNSNPPPPPPDRLGDEEPPAHEAAENRPGSPLTTGGGGSPDAAAQGQDTAQHTDYTAMAAQLAEKVKKIATKKLFDTFLLDFAQELDLIRTDAPDGYQAVMAEIEAKRKWFAR